MWIDRWINSDEEFSLDSCPAGCDRLQRGAGRGYHTCTDHDIYSCSECTASLGDRAADRNFYTCTDPGTYPDYSANRDLHACTDPDTYADYGAGRLLARR